MRKIKRIFDIAEIILHSILVILCAIIAGCSTNILVSIGFTIITFLAGLINLLEILDFLEGMEKR